MITEPIKKNNISLVLEFTVDLDVDVNSCELLAALAKAFKPYIRVYIAETGAIRHREFVLSFRRS